MDCESVNQPCPIFYVSKLFVHALCHNPPGTSLKPYNTAASKKKPATKPKKKQLKEAEATLLQESRNQCTAYQLTHIPPASAPQTRRPKKQRRGRKFKRTPSKCPTCHATSLVNMKDSLLPPQPSRNSNREMEIAEKQKIIVSLILMTLLPSF